MATAPRPRTTTRDPETLALRLTAWLDARLPGAEVTGVRAPESNGMSSETLLFDIDHPGTPLRACAVRLAADPDAYTVFPVYGLRRQYETMRDVARHTDLPVPRVLWLEEDPAPLGAPFFVMERVEGRVPPDVMPYTYEGNWLHSATDGERARLEEATISVIARLHDQYPVGSCEGSALRRHVDAQRDYYAWVVDGLLAHRSSRAPSTGWRRTGPPTRARPFSRGATPASATSSTTASSPPRARSTSAGRCTCTASSRI